MKINYFKKWDSKGYTYDQTVNISKKQLSEIQSEHFTEFVKNNEDKENKRDYYYKLYLGNPTNCERKKSIVFTNHTQRDFFAKILGIKLKNRNTCFCIN